MGGSIEGGEGGGACLICSKTIAGYQNKYFDQLSVVFDAFWIQVPIRFLLNKKVGNMYVDLRTRLVR